MKGKFLEANAKGLDFEAEEDKRQISQGEGNETSLSLPCGRQKSNNIL